MLLSRDGTVLNVRIEERQDYHKILENGFSSMFTFVVDKENLGIFFPDWESYIDRERPYDTLRVEDGGQIEALNIRVMPNVSDTCKIEGHHDVVGYKCELAPEFEDDEKRLNYESFLDFAGVVYYKVAPELRFPFLDYDD